MKIVVGLGNPGKQYVKTRHNIGFVIVDALREHLSRYDIGEWSMSKKFNGAVAGCTIRGERIVLLKPMTFMNESGQSVQLLAQFYKATAKDIIVVHDEKDLPLGEIKSQHGRGHAGHNGVKSIISHIGTQDFTRIRVGVGGSDRQMKNTSSFVLGKFGFSERKIVKQIVEKSTTLIHELVIPDTV